MSYFLVRRGIGFVLTLIAVSVVVFAVMNVLPGDPSLTILGIDSTEEARAALRERLGLDEPVVSRYLAWTFGALRGEFGTSYAFDVPVAELIAERLPMTLSLAISGMALTVVLALVLGIAAAARHGGPGDWAIMLFSQLGIAVPILPPAGALLGFLDADAAPVEWLGHANALLHTAACIIEHRLIETEPQGFLLLRFHRYASVLGTPLEALVLFDAEGAVMLANHTARALLAPCAFSAGGAAACFATQWCGIVGYAALGLRQPFVLRDRRGGGFSAQASLRRHAS